METAGTEAAQSTVQVRTTVFGLVFVHLSIAWIAPLIIHAPSPVIPLAAPFLLGLLIGQMMLLAIWITYGSDPFIRRLLISFAVSISIIYAGLIGSQVMGDEFSIANSPVDVLFLGIALVVGLVLLQIPLWFVSRFWEHWQLVAPWAENHFGSKSKQFNLRSMVSVTAVIAFALSIGRLLVPANALLTLGTISPDEIVAMLTTFTLYPMVNLIIILPCVRSAFSRRPIVLLFTAWFFFLALITFIEARMIGTLTSRPKFLSLLVVNVAQCASVFVSLRVLRIVGFRLTRAACAK